MERCSWITITLRIGPICQYEKSIERRLWLKVLTMHLTWFIIVSCNDGLVLTDAWNCWFLLHTAWQDCLKH